MNDDDKVKPLKTALFSPGEITISPEAFQWLRDAGLTPADLVNRHTQGEWDGGPVKWIARNHDVIYGRQEGPIMSVYQLHPSEIRVCVSTTNNRAGTSLTVWPEPDGHRAAVPIDVAERLCKETGMSTPAAGQSVSEVFRAWGKNKSVARSRPHEKGPTRYGPGR
jgi:hypothetical protein